MGDSETRTGNQRLSVQALEAWENLGFGMFIHFGLSTFVSQELPSGQDPSTTYAPDRLDVDQWIQVARDTGMRYAVLTSKHVSGHCLWQSSLTDYHVGTSGNTTDVVEQFVEACRRHGLMPGFYYCSWDNHHRFGSRTWSDLLPGEPFTRQFTTRQYEDFQWGQLEELLTRYGPIGEVWIDIPMALSRDYRNRLYAHLASMQPDAVIVMNNGIGDGSPETQSVYAWPTDVVTIERYLPDSRRGHAKWRQVEGAEYYLPGEVCDPVGHEWFYVEGDTPRSDAELLGMYLTTRGRGANLLLDVGPDTHGLLPEKTVAALERLRKGIDRAGG